MRSFVIVLVMLSGFAYVAHSAETAPESAPADTGPPPRESLVEFPVQRTPVPSPDITPPVGTSSAIEMTPGPSPEKSAPGLFDRLARIYGVFKPTAIYAFNALESFSQPNESGVTAAANPALAIEPDHSRLTAQVMQSRLGIFLNERGKYTGHIEVDFYNSQTVTPIYVNNIRVRFLTVAIALTDSLLLEGGLDSDLNAPLDPHTNNLAGDLYEAGNFGAKRQQLKLVYRPNGYEIAMAVGFPGTNPGNNPGFSGDGPFELSGIPTIAVRAAVIGTHVTAGVSALATRLQFERGTPDATTHSAGAAAVYFVADPTEDLDIRFEANMGHNAGNIRTLALGYGHGVRRDATGEREAGAANVDEIGGFLSVRQRLFHSIHALYAMAGYAAILNKAGALPAYGPDPVTGILSVTELITGPGLKRNMAARIGYELRPTPTFAWVLEGMYYDTVHILRQQEAGLNPHRTAFGIETGFQLTF